MNLNFDTIKNYLSSIKLPTFNWSTNIFLFLAGFLSCLYLTKSKCVYVPDNIQIVETEKFVFKTDTLVQIITKEVPKPVYIYKKVTDIPKWILDSLNTKDKWLVKTDTFFKDTLLIGINHYEDSVKTEDYELKWTAETFGYLTSMIPELTIYIDSTVVSDNNPVPVTIPSKNHIDVSLGISTLGHFKPGLGFNGWMIEPELTYTDKLKMPQIWLSKTFNININKKIKLKS